MLSLESWSCSLSDLGCTSVRCSVWRMIANLLLTGMIVELLIEVSSPDGSKPEIESLAWVRHMTSEYVL